MAERSFAQGNQRKRRSPGQPATPALLPAAGCPKMPDFGRTRLAACNTSACGTERIVAKRGILVMAMLQPGSQAARPRKDGKTQKRKKAKDLKCHKLHRPAPPPLFSTQQSGRRTLHIYASTHHSLNSQATGKVRPLILAKSQEWGARSPSRVIVESPL